MEITYFLYLNDNNNQEDIKESHHYYQCKGAFAPLLILREEKEEIK